MSIFLSWSPEESVLANQELASSCQSKVKVSLLLENLPRKKNRVGNKMHSLPRLACRHFVQAIANAPSLFIAVSNSLSVLNNLKVANETSWYLKLQLPPAIVTPHVFSQVP